MDKQESNIDRLLKARADIDEKLHRHKTTLTVLFTDVVGSTDYFDRYGDTAGIGMLHRHTQLGTRTVEEFKGRVIKTIGDSVMAEFSEPTSAARAAMEIQRRLLRLNQTLPERDRLRLRIGINTGPVFRDDAGDVYGDAVNVAARITKQTEPAQILVSRSFRDAITHEPGFSCIPKGTVEMKGKTDKEEIFELTWLEAPEAVAAFPSIPSAEPVSLELTQGDTVILEAPEVDPANLRAGTVFANRYAIERELGHGGFGTVYAAFDRSPLQRVVALKIIHLASSEASERTILAKQRFLDEARLAGGLSHSNVATIFEAGEFSGCIYMTQELAAGRDLRKILHKTGPLALRRVIAITRQICEGLAHAHSKSVVHRDIKPGNIVVDTEDRVKITDFGLAQPEQAEDSTPELVVAGTPGYMAPEQLRNERLDTRADIFAVGCVLYEMLTGRPPFAGETAASVIEKTLNVLPPDPSRVREDLPRALDRIVARAMRKDREARYQNATLLAQDLQNYEQFEYLSENKRAAEEIIAGLEAKQCVLFLGLRLPVASTDKRTVTSDRVIAEHLAERLGVPSRERSLSRITQDFELERGRAEMLRHLASAVRSPGVSPREIIRRVARLPINVIVTTQYDTFLEEELTRVGRKICRILDCRKVPDDIGNQDLLVRLFGSVDVEASIVVTDDDLWSFFGTFNSLSDSLKSIFARQRILFVGYDPEDEGFRHLLTEIGHFRAGNTGGCYLPATDISLSSLRWAQRKGLRLIDTEPGPFLTLLEETGVERQRDQHQHQSAAREVRLPSRPYKFLNYFDVEDQSIFFGRRIEIQKFLSKIHSYSLNLLYAPSGSGKTSLIRAGLMPRLEADGYCPIYTRVYDDPLGEMRRAVLSTVGTVAAEFSHVQPMEKLLPALAVRANRRLVVFVDQFEEIFIRYDRDARDRFVATLDSILAEAKGQVRFVLSLREDFLARLSEFRDRIPTIFHNEFRLASLSDEASRSAIVEPAKLLGLSVDPELVERLLIDLSREGIDPPQLQIVCDTLYDNLGPGEKALTLKSYLRLGETRKILTNYLEGVLRELAPTDRDAAREMLKNLVTSEQTKTVCRITDLVRAVGRSEDEVSHILSDLSDRRMIRRVQREEGYWYELTHEYLVEEISRWLSEREKEVKKIRELFEQALRNYRNLGILMPAAQVRLVKANEDDLHVSKEERQFLRISEQALSDKKRRIVTFSAAAAVVLLVFGVVWRFVYLTTRVFIQPQDSEFIQYQYGRKESHRFEGLRVYAGSPARSWLDARLGFPRLLYQTDFELDQLDPARRDSVKVGLMFGRNALINDEVYQLLQPDAKVRFLITQGRLNEALQLMPRLYQDPSIDKESIDGIVGMMAYSGVSDETFIQDAIRQALLGNRRSFVNFTDGSANAHLIGLLRNLPDDRWRDLLRPYFANDATRRDAISLTGMVGNERDIASVAPFSNAAQSGMESVQSAAFQALIDLEDCSLISRARRLANDPTTDESTETPLLGYIRLCGDETDLPYFEAAARRKAQAGMGQFFSAMTLRDLYRMLGHASIPAIRRVLASQSGLGKVRTLEFVTDPVLVPDLEALVTRANSTDVRAQAVDILATRGQTSALAPAAEITLDHGQKTSTRGRALEAFKWFKGPRLRAFLLRMIKETRPEEVEIVTSVYSGLRWYDDDETMVALIRGLEDKDDFVRMAALESLTFRDSEPRRRRLHDAQHAGTPQSQVYVARSLQLLDRGKGDIYGGVFKRFLEKDADASKDYPALVKATVGLRDALLDQPASAAVDALRNPRREIRLAGLLALIERSDHPATAQLLASSPKEKDPYLRAEINRVLWAMKVVQIAEAQLQRAVSALSAGKTRRASRILNNVDQSFRAFAYKEILKVGLSTTKPTTQGQFQRFYILGEAFSPAVDRFAILNWEIDTKEGGGVSRFFPGRREMIAKDPYFDPLKATYEFRVDNAMQEPILVENINLPDVTSKVAGR